MATPGAALALDADGDITLAGTLVEGLDAIKQHVRVRCLTIKGEWFLDADEGVPYREAVWVKNPDRVRIASAFRQVIEQTPGVRSVLQINVQVDGGTRVGTVSFRASTDAGELVDAFNVGGKTE